MYTNKKNILRNLYVVFILPSYFPFVRMYQYKREKTSKESKKNKFE